MFKKPHNWDYNLEHNIELKFKYVKDVSWLSALLKPTSKLEIAIVKAMKEENCNKRAKSAALLEYEHSVL